MVSLDASAEVIIPEVIKRDRRVEWMPATTLGVGLPVVVVGIVVWLCVVRLCCVVGGGRQTILDNEKSLSDSAGGMSPYFVFGEVGFSARRTMRWSEKSPEHHTVVAS